MQVFPIGQARSDLCTHHSKIHTLASILAQCGIIRRSIPIDTRRVRREASLLREAVNPPQHKLHHTISGAGRILGDHVPAETDFHESQASLRMRRTEDTCAR